MIPSSLFDWTAEALERASSLTRLEARGVLRLALQKRELDPKDLGEGQVVDLLEGDLPRDLAERGVADAPGLCRRIRQDLAARLSAAEAPPAAGASAAPPSLFDWVTQAVETETTLSRLEARGTWRLALKDAGLVPERATRRQVEVVLQAVAPKHLSACSVRDAEAVCGRILTALRSAVVLDGAAAESPEDVFGRFGRR